MSNLSREEWLKERLNGIGGSEAGIVMGLSPFKSRLELWHEKVERNVDINLEEELIFQIGHALEPIIANEYAKMTNRVLEVRPQRVHPNYPFITGNVDREIVKSERQTPGILEIKTKGAWTNWHGIEIPPYINAQLQQYLAVYNYTWGSIAVLDLGSRTIRYIDVERDDVFIERLIEAEVDFWKLVQNKIPPKIDASESCEQFLKDRYSKGTSGKIIDLKNNKDASVWSSVLKSVRQSTKLLKKQELDCKNNLMNIMQDAELGIGENYKITWKSPVDKLEFDVETFKKVHPLLYDKFVKLEPQSRKFTVKFNKD